MYGEGRLVGAFERGFVELGGVAYLKRNVYRRLSLPGVACQEVEAVYVEVFFVGRSRLVSFAYVEDVRLHVFLHGIPRAAAEAEAVALADGVEP